MRKLSILLMFFVTLSSHAATFSQAKAIYQRIVAANGIRAPMLTLSNSSEVNAQCGFMSISINKGMLAFVRNDDELALVLGHELAHFNLGHTSSTPMNELAADSLGAKYEDRAGFNHCKGVMVLYRFHSAGSDTHPASDYRYKRLQCYIEF